MGTFKEEQDRLLFYASEDSEGDALTQAKADLNRTYFAVLRAINADTVLRELRLTTTAGVAATVTGTATENFTITAGSTDQFKVSVNGGASSTITLTAGTRTAAQISNDINEDGPDGLSAAATSTGAVKLTSSLPSSESDITISTVSNNAYTVLGFTAATVVGSGGSKYGLPVAVRDVLNIDDPDNRVSIINVTNRDYDRGDPGTVSGGDPNIYYHLGDYGVQVQPVTAGVIGVQSSLAADDGNRFLRVEGWTGTNSSGNWITEQVTLDGTTEVNTTASFGTIERLIKSTNATYTITGDITVQDSSNNQLARIPVWFVSPTYKWIEFHFIPSVARTYTLRTRMQKHPLVNDDDWPDFDEYFHDLLFLGAGSTFLLNLKPDVAAQCELRFREKMREFRKYGRRRPNQDIVMGDVSLLVALPSRPLILGVDLGLAR